MAKIVPLVRNESPRTRIGDVAPSVLSKIVAAARTREDVRRFAHREFGDISVTFTDSAVVFADGTHTVSVKTNDELSEARVPMKEVLCHLFKLALTSQ